MMPDDHRARKRLEGFEEALAKAGLSLVGPRILLRRLGPAEGPRDDGGDPEAHARTWISCIIPMT